MVGPRVEDAPLLQVEDLAVSFTLDDGGHVQAVDGVNLAVFPGQTVALVGESGCGKSVTALSTLQLVPRPPGRIDRGRIRFQGRDLLALSEEEMLEVRGRRIAMIFQEPMTSLNPVYSVGEQIMEAIRLHQRVSRRRVREIAVAAMEKVGIVEAQRRIDDYPHQFSGGMRQRVMIAMALACQPRLLVADEPTTALDVTIQAQILELLRDIQRRQDMGILLITHDLGVVAQMADVVCVVYAGRVMEYARVDRLFARRHHPYTRGLLGCIPRLVGRRPRLTTIEDLLSDPEEFRKLPGYQYGIVPWWPAMDAPAGLPGDARENAYCLHEIEPEHWVGCWRTSYLAQHPNRPPAIRNVETSKRRNVETP